MLKSDLEILHKLSDEEKAELIEKHLGKLDEDDMAEIISATLDSLAGLKRPSLAINAIMELARTAPNCAKPTEHDLDLMMDAIDRMCIPSIDTVTDRRDLM